MLMISHVSALKSMLRICIVVKNPPFNCFSVRVLVYSNWHLSGDSKFIGTYGILCVHLAFCWYFVVNKNTVRQAKAVQTSFLFLQVISTDRFS